MDLDIVVLVAVVGGGLPPHREVANLRERMARLERLLEGFTGATKGAPQ